MVKLTEKCGLNSAGSSPCVTPLRTPEDLKSNILKAQAEVAALKVRNRPGGEKEGPPMYSDSAYPSE